MVDFIVKYCQEEFVWLGLCEIWFFGSRARGIPRPDSDWDFFVVLSDDAPHGFNLNEPLQHEWQIKIRQVALNAGVIDRSDGVAIFTTYKSCFQRAKAIQDSPCARAAADLTTLFDRNSSSSLAAQPSLQSTPALSMAVGMGCPDSVGAAELDR